jgi:hypothetical protein
VLLTLIGQDYFARYMLKGEFMSGLIGNDATLHDFFPGDSRLASPTEVTDTPVDPSLELLPTHEMTWPNFERLLIRVAREVQGLRSVRSYGVSGQAQHGIDLVGINSGGENEAVQGKRYQAFALADLNKAVKKYLEGKLPFTVRRLAVGVSCEANDKHVTDRIIDLNEAHPGIEFELWDRGRLSEMLRGRPDIVLEFFGPATANSFCGNYVVGPQPVPPLDAITVADAITRGPAEACGASEDMAAAEQSRTTDPNGAVAHVKNAQAKLRGAGFAAHARVLNDMVTTLLIAAGHHYEAALVSLDGVWSALADDRTDDAAQLSRQLKTLADAQGDPIAQGLAAVADAAVSSCQHPLGQPPDLTVLNDDIPAIHRARLLLLAGETELAAGNIPFDEEAAGVVQTLLSDITSLDEALAVRLQICLAESIEDNWVPLLKRARTRQIPRALAALVFARHARYLANQAEPEDADSEWSEAIEQGCLAKINGDAANWLYARRMLTTRFRPLTPDTYHPLASSLRADAGQPSVVGASARAYEQALAEMQADKLRSAAIRLQRHLRDAVVGASWAEEHTARKLLADILKRSGEPSLAAHHLILAGVATDAHELGKGLGDQYLPAVDYLDAPSYWCKAAALRLIAAQADLVPDAEVDLIAESALKVIDQVKSVAGPRVLIQGE